MHPLFWDPELSKMHLHPQIQISNAFPALICDNLRVCDLLYSLHQISFCRTYSSLWISNLSLQVITAYFDIWKFCLNFSIAFFFSVVLSFLFQTACNSKQKPWLYQVGRSLWYVKLIIAFKGALQAHNCSLLVAATKVLIKWTRKWVKKLESQLV